MLDFHSYYQLLENFNFAQPFFLTFCIIRLIEQLIHQIMLGIKALNFDFTQLVPQLLVQLVTIQVVNSRSFVTITHNFLKNFHCSFGYTNLTILLSDFQYSLKVFLLNQISMFLSFYQFSLYFIIILGSLKSIHLSCCCLGFGLKLLQYLESDCHLIARGSFQRLQQ